MISKVQDTDQDEFKIYFTPKQTVALETMNDPKVRELLYGGAKGGGKSVFLVQWAFLQCQKLMHLFNIPANPATILPVGFLGRKRGTDFSKTTLETWKKIIPSSLYHIRPLDREIVVENRVKIHYGGMDDESNVKKFNSAEYAFVGVDQAEEMEKDDLGLLKGTLRLRMNDAVPDYKVLLTANPAPCFLKQDYIDSPPLDGSKVFIQALPHDNPFLDNQYIETLMDAFKHRPELIKAYVHGSWDDISGLDILIKYNWLNNCIDKDQEYFNRRVTSADVAHFGPDETVIYNLIDNKVVAQSIKGMLPAPATAAEILRMASNNNSDIIAIDADGYGAGVVDILSQMLKHYKGEGMKLLALNSGKAPHNTNRFKNAKTEMWFYAADQIAEGLVGIPNDAVLMNDLASIKYFMITQGRFQVESKREARKRLNRSPDRGDAIVYGIWASQFVKRKTYDYKRQDFNKTPRRNSYGWDAFADGAIVPGFNRGGTYGW